MADSKRKQEKLEDYSQENEQETAIRRSCWNLRELKALNRALQRYGPADVKKIAAHVKTRSIIEVGCCIQERLEAVYQKRNASRKDPKDWASLQKWINLIHMQIYPDLYNSDFSRDVIVKVWQKWYDEIPEPKDQQLVDVKMIYKYFLECMKGEVPPHLPPKESSVVLNILETVDEVPKKFDFAEELEFIRNFKGKPNVVRADYLENSNMEASSSSESEVPSVIVSDLFFLFYQKYKNIFESFNPLMVPKRLVEKEQNYLSAYFNDKYK